MSLLSGSSPIRCTRRPYVRVRPGDDGTTTIYVGPKATAGTLVAVISVEIAADAPLQGIHKEHGGVALVFATTPPRLPEQR